MKKQMLKRILAVLLVLAVLVFLALAAFFLYLKVSPDSVYNSPALSEVQRAFAMEHYKLDQPVPVQFAAFVKHVFTGSWGFLAP